MVKIKIHNKFENLFEKFLTEHVAYASIKFEKIQNVSNYKFKKNATLYLITINEEIKKGRSFESYKFWFGYHFSHFLVLNGINPAQVI